MKCVVTGGCGFLGSHLVEKLVKENHKVTVIDNFSTGNKSNLSNLSVKIVRSDINNTKKIKKYFKNVDWVFHLAALADIVPSIENPSKYFYSNVVGTLNILELCKKTKIKKFVYIASSSCYGIAKKYPTKENSEIKPEYPYALTKYLGEEIALHWSKVYKIPLISLRCFNIYGPRSRTSGAYGAVIGVFLAQMLNNKPLTIVGSGKQKRDFTYVTDVVDAIIIAARSKVKNKIFNIGSGNTISVNKLAKLIGGKKIKIPKRPGEPFITYADISKIKKELNWKPKINIKYGIEKVMAEKNFWKQAPVWTKKKIKVATKSWFKYLSK
tara:strand:- start:612 stop:1586 length:975 start_codon:yes stop_codon:yes gene_type:complete